MVYRKKKDSDIPMSDVMIAEKHGQQKYHVPKESKVIQYYLGVKKQRIMAFQRCNILKARFKPQVLDKYP